MAFIRSAYGTFTYLPFPPGANPGTTGINDHGEVVGFYANEFFNSHAFIADKKGIHTFDVPGSVYTFLSGINASGVVVGSYVDANFAGHPFYLDSGGPHELTIPGAQYINPYTINSRGEICGSYHDETGDHGFVYNRGKVSIITRPFPNATDTITRDIGGTQVTFAKLFEGNGASDINDRSDVVGYSYVFYLSTDPNFPFGLIFSYPFWAEPIP